MKLLLLFLCALLTGCASSRTIAIIKHADGSGETHYKYIVAGGIIRPGVIVVVAETIGSNAPVVLTQASGSALTPSVISASGIVGAAATLGATLRPDHTENTTSSATVIPGVPQGPPPIPNPPSRPPFGPPPWHGQHPNNRGH